MNEKKFLRMLVKASIAIIILLLIPVFVFIFYFRNQQISTDVANWGAFGSYIGGVIGVIVALANLVVLIMITIQVQKLNNEGNKNFFLYKKRVEAYDELAKFFPFIEYYTNELKLILKDSVLKNREDFSVDDLDTKLNDLRCSYRDFYYFINSFNERFEHLFKYNFYSKDHKELEKSLTELKKSIDTFMSYESIKKLDFEYFNKTNQLMKIQFSVFIHEIQKELIF
ncbi:MAG TPA: hypothetical protein PKH79_00050 [Prolixibacteraceae bacterium]|nr:hypothetical protein [Prolixibacteraceae bacterium]HPS11926.1 hypothetical protein [Prolixibacteraceae bacterium]